MPRSLGNWQRFLFGISAWKSNGLACFIYCTCAGRGLGQGVWAVVCAHGKERIFWLVICKKWQPSRGIRKGIWCYANLRLGCSQDDAKQRKWNVWLLPLSRCVLYPLPQKGYWFCCLLWQANKNRNSGRKKKSKENAFDCYVCIKNTTLNLYYKLNSTL